MRKALWCAEKAGIADEQRDAGGAFGLANGPAYRMADGTHLNARLADPARRT